jgi:tetratricopeptide (TPR) repeat protein
MKIINISETIHVIGETYSISNLSILAILSLFVIGLLFIFGRKFIEKIAENSADDLYSKIKGDSNNSKKEEHNPLEPEPTKPLLLSFAVPQINPNFTGREDILAQLRGVLTSGEIGMWKQALTGLGGKGKSQIAAKYAYNHQEDYKFIYWLRSEEPIALAANYAGLASELGLPEKDSADQTIIITAVKRWLGNNSGWLLIFDNAGSSEEIAQYLPREGTGHAIITSRNPNWGGASGVIPVEVFERKESIEFLFKRTKQKEKETASKLAEALGDLPLALEQAGAYIEESAISLADYLMLFQEQRKEILKRGKPAAYPETVATTWGISFRAVEEKSPEAADLLRLFAFLAPDNIPRFLLVEGARNFPETLGYVVDNEIKFNAAVAALRRYSLLGSTGDGFSIHRLVQAVMLDSLTKDEKRERAEVAVKLVNGSFSFDINDPETWEKTSFLLPNALASSKHSEELEVALEETGRLLNNAGLYLRLRAEFQDAETTLRRALKIDEVVYGTDHANVAISVNGLGLVLLDLGQLEEAKKCFERALRIDEVVYGTDNPNVAIRVNNLGSVLQDLGQLEGAKKCFERALKIDEAVYGTNHPNMAIRVNNLGSVLQDLGQLEEAKKCFERALKINEAVYGTDNPNVAFNVNNLGLVLRDLGQLEEAKKCFERALRILQKRLGKNHSSTRTVQSNLEFLKSGKH